jgi:hypothetical protein
MVTPSGCFDAGADQVCIFNVQTRTVSNASDAATRSLDCSPVASGPHVRPRSGFMTRRADTTVERSNPYFGAANSLAAPVRDRETLLGSIERDRTPLDERYFCHPLWPFRRRRD